MRRCHWWRIPRHDPGLVSFKFAPSFRQAPIGEAVGRNTKDIAPNLVAAYVTADFVSEREEAALLSLTNPWFDRLDYCSNHIDSLIHHYKEFYRSYTDLMRPDRHDDAARAAPSSEETMTLVRAALRKCHDAAQEYLPNIPIDDRVHFLRLDGGGFIRAHVDESRNSSGIVAGLSLNSGRVMTLTHPRHPEERVELLIRPRAFYVLIGTARYEWEHSVDWERDDDEHLQRVRKDVVVEGSPVTFAGGATPWTRASRTAVVFRGVSPMALLARRVGGRPSG